MVVSVAAFAATLLASEQPAAAQARPGQTAADALFNEGRELLEKGRFAEACPKLAKSEELAPAVGTLLNLGYCWEQLAKLRSAMDSYAEAETLALTAGDTKRAAFAKERFRAVEPRAMKLIVRVAPPEVPGLEIKRNGVVLTKSELEHPIAVDPEDFTVTATAPGHEPWKGGIIVRGEGATVTMIVPPLADPKGGGGGGAMGGTNLSVRRIAALGLGGLSALALGGGLAAAVSAKARYNDASSHCDASGCDAVGASIQSGAVAQGNLATGFIGFGVLAAAAGVYLWLTGGPSLGVSAMTSPPRSAARLELGPFGTRLGGSF
jgi:hypothetical protein